MDEVVKLKIENAELKKQLSETQGALKAYKDHLENALGRLVIMEFKRDHKNELKKETE